MDQADFTGQFRGPAQGNAAVHQDMDAVAVVRLKPDQVAGVRDTGFGAEMGDGV